MPTHGTIFSSGAPTMGPKNLLDKITKFDSYKIIIGIPISEQDLSGFPAHLQSRVQSLLANAP